MPVVTKDRGKGLRGEKKVVFDLTQTVFTTEWLASGTCTYILYLPLARRLAQAMADDKKEKTSQTTRPPSRGARSILVMNISKDMSLHSAYFASLHKPHPPSLHMQRSIPFPPSLLTNLTILVPMGKPPDEPPLPSRVPDALAKDVKWDPAEHNGATDSRHSPESALVARRGDPGVGVEGEEEAEGGCVGEREERGRGQLRDFLEEKGWIVAIQTYT